MRFKEMNHTSIIFSIFWKTLYLHKSNDIILDIKESVKNDYFKCVLR
jgi:hypothetical protein|nr:MAG TPA: hypothetical protein [Caudoviricetes sp.]DAS14536.1 MAG TPA: hypothetical protein [Caudoviricetes sp.]